MKTFLCEAGRLRKKAAVVISFDDGYRDNDDAAKILRMENVPSAFFVSNGIIGKTNPCPFDVRLNRRLTTQSASEAGKMSCWGFRISNRSINHCNTGKISIANSANEVQRLMQDIAPKTGDKDDEHWFSFSFGRPDSMKNGVVEQPDHVDNVGNLDCFSASADVNEKKFNRHDIARQAVSHQFSELAFRALVEGYLIR